LRAYGENDNFEPSAICVQRTRRFGAVLNELDRSLRELTELFYGIASGRIQ
jgi:hypothetical protein